MTGSESGEVFGEFHFVPPPAVAAAIRRELDKAKMTTESHVARIHNFIDGLSADDLLTLRFMLHTPKLGRMTYDGQIVAIMRRIHHVDPFTAEAEMPTLTE